MMQAQAAVNNITHFRRAAPGCCSVAVGPSTIPNGIIPMSNTCLGAGSTTRCNRRHAVIASVASRPHAPTGISRDAPAATPAAVTVTERPGADRAVAAPDQENVSHTQQFNWNKQWYPVALIENLEASEPHAVQLLGMNLVVWRDGTGTWRAFKDCCPHRLAPLSEGRVDSKTGNLFCNYHGWQFDGNGACTHIPQQPKGAPFPNPQRSCAVSFPTAVSEDLLWIWADSSPTAAAEAAAAVGVSSGGHLGIAPELEQFGPAAYWSTKLGFENNTSLGTWYQRFCNASYLEVKRNVFNDPSHDTVLHHGLGGLTRDKAAPGEVQEFTMDEKGYRIKRLNAGTGRVVTDTCVFPVAIRRDFAGDPRYGSGVGYVTPTTPGRCNMIIGITRHPEFAQKPKGLTALLTPFLPNTPKWLQHITLHDVVDADIVMQSGADVNMANNEGLGYMPAIGMDQGPIAFTRWLQKYGGNGPQVAKLPSAMRSGSHQGTSTTSTTNSSSNSSNPVSSTGLPAGDNTIFPLPREQLISRYHSHTKHCKACSGALANFRKLCTIATVAAVILAAASLGTAVSAATASVSAPADIMAAVSSALWPASLLLAALATVAASTRAWCQRMIAKFVFVDYDSHHVSKQ